jgi:hypothetical protein
MCLITGNPGPAPAFYTNYTINLIWTLDHWFFHSAADSRDTAKEFMGANERLYTLHYFISIYREIGILKIISSNFNSHTKKSFKKLGKLCSSESYYSLGAKSKLRHNLLCGSGSSQLTRLLAAPAPQQGLLNKELLIILM